MTVRCFIAAALALMTGWACATPGLDSAQAIGPYLNGVFPETTPGPNGTWGVANAFPNLTFIDPVKVVKDPLSAQQIYVVCRNGEIWHVPFSASATSAQKVKFLDRRANTWGYWDTGMLSMAFHPEFGQAGSPNRGYVYVFYQYVPEQPTSQNVGNPSYMRLSRFTLADGAATLDPASEYVMIQQFDRHNWHSGGQMFFAQDGFLHVIVGDEGDSNDSHNQAQKINNRLFSGILRIDVDCDPNRSHPVRRQPLQIAMPAGWAPSFTQGYYIPDDNPWLDPNGGILEEFWTVGTRSPYSMFLDKATGDIWVAEVGQSAREEITIAREAGNHQWPYMEGSIPGPKGKPSGLIGIENPPVYDYGRSMGGCIIGGMVYRGTQHSGALTGKYIFGDHNTKAIYVLERPEGAAVTAEYLTSVQRAGGDKQGLSGICEGPDGEVYITELGDTGTDTGRIYKLVRTGEVVADPPQLLSQTGAFSNLATLTPRAGLIPYDVNSPLWSDGAEKLRWIAVPNNGTHNTAGEQVTYRETGAWDFPVGTVLVKHFALPVDERDPSVVKPVETRFFVHGSDDVYYGVTYRWNDAGTDATLLGGGAFREMEITKSDGTTRTQRWDFPSRSDCRTCHSTSADNVLGLRSHQMAREITYPATGRTANQLETWNALGLFGTSFGSRNPALLPHSVDPHDPKASLDQRVKSYLDANCSHCHHPGGVSANWDATYSTELFAQGIINGNINRPINDPDEEVVDPGNLALSLLHGRASVVGAGQMPPLAKNVVDEKAVALLADWIRSLDNAEFPASTSAGIEAEYYAGRNFETLKLSRTEATINYAWGTSSPAEVVPVDSFSARWKAKILPPSTGTYTFYSTADDGIRVKINGTWVINAWGDSGPTERSGTINLTAGQLAEVVVEYYENGGGAQVNFSWSGPGITKQIIPASSYRLAAAASFVPVAVDDEFTATHGARTTLNVLANDEDQDAPLGIHGVAIIDSPSHGSVRIDGAGKRLIYTHDGLAGRTDSFTYRVTDPQGFKSNVATVHLNIPFDFTAWAAATDGADGNPASNEDGDLYPDLLEFALGMSPLSGAFPHGDPVALVEENGNHALKVKHPAGLSGISFEILTSPDLVTWTAGAAPTISTEGGDEVLTFASLQNRPGLSADRGFVRLRVKMDGSSFSAMTLPWGWLAADFGSSSRTLGVPFRPLPVFSSKVTSSDGPVIGVMGNPSLPPSFAGYVEVIAGPLVGHRYEVESTADGAITLASAADLTGSTIVVCEHRTLDGIFTKSLFKGSTNPGAADQVQFYINDGETPGRFELYYLLDARPGNATHQWRAFIPGGGDKGRHVIRPDEGVFVKRPAGAPPAQLILTGQVRANAFSNNLHQGVNLIASPFPLDSTPRKSGLLDPAAGFTASTNVNAADQFQIHQNGAFRIFYLLNHPTLPDPWRETVPGSPDYSDVPLFKPTDAIFLKRNEASDAYQIPPPWNPSPP